MNVLTELKAATTHAIIAFGNMMERFNPTFDNLPPEIAAALRQARTKSRSQPIKIRSADRQLRDWIANFEVTGRAGETIDVQHQSQVLFRGERLIATDDSKTPGKSTVIEWIFVGQNPQTPVIGFKGTLTDHFAPNAVGNNEVWKTCQPAQTITMRIKFLHDCTFHATSFGKALI